MFLQKHAGVDQLYVVSYTYAIYISVRFKLNDQPILSIDSSAAARALSPRNVYKGLSSMD